MRRLVTHLRLAGLMLMVFSLTYLLPIFSALYYGDGTLSVFLKSMLITLSAGLGCWLPSRHQAQELKARDGFILVFGAWIGMAAFSTLPLLGAIEGLSFTDAYFESMSGLSTTGATVLINLDYLPPSLNLWRHELNWVGGMGIIVLVVAILPVLGVGGRQLYVAEIPGPMKDSKLTPRITETAKNLWLTYAAITLACLLALKLAGMDWFDALCHAFATMSLGGFSTHDNSIGFYDSPEIEGVLILFMLMAGMNFATHFTAFRARDLSPYREDLEAGPFLLLVIGSLLALSVLLWHDAVYPSFWTSLRHTAFNLVSIATDCGFTSQDYAEWPLFAPIWMVLLSCLASCTGSTGGGIKMMRTLILWKQTALQLFLLTHPTAVNPLKLGRQVISDRIILSVLGFIFAYFATVVALTLLLVLTGVDPFTAVSAVLACLNNAGPGLGEFGPTSTYRDLSDFQTWLMTGAMLLGRIEIFTALVLLTPAFWRK